MKQAAHSTIVLLAAFGGHAGTRRAITGSPWFSQPMWLADTVSNAV